MNWRMRMVNISVIVTVYNIKDYIKECLDSILDQTGVEYEVICIDDASTDGSDLILDQYAKKYENMIVIHRESNGGLATARNEGYRHASGEYLYNIDGDDVLLKDALAIMYRYVKENNLDLLGFEATSFFDEDSLRKYGSENEYVRKHKYLEVYNGAELFCELMKNGDRVAANRVLYCYKRTYFLENNLFDEEGLRYADDSMFAYYMTAKRAMCISEQLYLRRYRTGSAVTSPFNMRYLESMVVRFWSELCSWQNLMFSEEINEQISNYFDSKLTEIRRGMIKLEDKQIISDYLTSHVVEYYFYKRFIKAVPINTSNISDTELKTIKNAKNIILYGAGIIANEAADFLEDNGIYDYDVAVTFIEDSNLTFRDKRIRKIGDLADNLQSIVIVAMSKKNKEDVQKILDSYGFNNVIWF